MTRPITNNKAVITKPSQNSIRSHIYTGWPLFGGCLMNSPPADIRICEKKNKQPLRQQHETQGAVCPNEGRQPHNESSNWKNI